VLYEQAYFPLKLPVKVQQISLRKLGCTNSFFDGSEYEHSDSENGPLAQASAPESNKSHFCTGTRTEISNAALNTAEWIPISITKYDIRSAAL